MVTLEQTRSVKTRVGSQLRGVSGFKGVGISWGKSGTPYVEVNVAPGKTEEFRRMLPDKMDNVEIRIAELKTAVALDDNT